MHYCITPLMVLFGKVSVTVVVILLIRWFILQNRTNFLDQFSEELHYPRTSKGMDEVFCLVLFYEISSWGELELSIILISLYPKKLHHITIIKNRHFWQITDFDIVFKLWHFFFQFLQKLTSKNATRFSSLFYY